MATLPVYNTAGEQVGEMETDFGAGAHGAVLHQVVAAQLAARRQGTAHTKRRGEVAGSGRKLWRQKGTGRARVGDRRPPHRVGGGRVTGPRMRSYRQRLARSLCARGLASALAAQAEAGSLALVEPFALSEAKTRALAGALEALGAGPGSLLVVAGHNPVLTRCGRNLPGVRIAAAGAVSATEVAAARRVLIATDALPRLQERVS